MKRNTTIKQLPSPASPSLIARINELATLHGKCSREWGESGATAQRDQHAGMSNLCLEILDWIERNPEPTPTEAAKVEPVDLQKLAVITLRQLRERIVCTCQLPEYQVTECANFILAALQEVASSSAAEIKRLKKDIADAEAIRIAYKGVLNRCGTAVNEADGKTMLHENIAVGVERISKKLLTIKGIINENE